MPRDSAGPPPLPLVQGTGFQGHGARHRLRGPPLADLSEECSASLQPVPTTVNDDGTVRFGDSLMLLNHGTEIPLQADISRQVVVIDDSHSQRKEFTAVPLTTARVMHPCGRNCFSVARANRDDGFGDSFEAHYGQHVRLLACSFLGDRLLYLHLEDPPSARLPRSNPVLLPRAAGRTIWRIMPGDVSAHREAVELARCVCVNEQVMLESVETGRLLMSATSSLVQTGFGAECSVYAEESKLHRPSDDKSVDEQRRCATWSFVNDRWADAVVELQQRHTGGFVWREDDGDDFQGSGLPPDDAADPPALQRLAGTERKRQEDQLALLARNPKAAICTRRVFPVLRAQGIHGSRRFRRSCISADIAGSGTIATHTFEGLLANFAVRVRPEEFTDLCEVFGSADPETVNYPAFFDFLRGIMSDQRIETLGRAYRKLRRTSSGACVTVDTLLKHWNPRCHPDVQAGTMDEQEACRDFASQWEVSHHDGHISPEEFLDYYRDVSACYDDSIEFIEMLRTAWDL
mmetsp:Transcript_7426/g.23328  ORF Transcript_7426/g.23328 Transcript_7426/m.23328 type:complete len:518 (-) Transcript_7426:360-1913(-)